MQNCPHCGCKTLNKGPIEGLVYSIGDRRVSYRDKSVDLRPTEMEIFSLLADRYPRTLTREELYGGLYDHKPDCDTPDGNVITVMICQLRKRLADAGFGITINRRTQVSAARKNYTLEVVGE